MRLGRLTLLACAGVLHAGASGAAVGDSNFTETVFVTGGSDATGMAWANDGSNRLFITYKSGTVRVVENGMMLSTPFATISPLYFGDMETGLLSVAFDPDFATNGFVYFFGTVSASEQQVIRYRANGNSGVDRVNVVTGLPTQGSHHDGGALAFGPDGRIYWGIGDLGGGDTQALGTLVGKIGRARRDGMPPGDNPFDDGSGPNNDLVWARGFRNPFTMAFHPSTERLWVNVVGTLFEQVFIVGAGDNGGYDEHENDQPSSFLSPVIAYGTNDVISRAIAGSGAVRAGGVSTFTTTSAHGIRAGTRITITGVSNTTFNSTGFVSAVPSATTFQLQQAGVDAMSGSGTVTTQNLGGCITGGAFYDSTSAAAEYRGNFFFGDFNTGNLMRARVSDSSVESVEIWGTSLGGIVDVDMGPDGDLYYARYQNPNVYRARFNATTQGLVVSKRNVRIAEGGTGAFSVRLATAPTSSVSVDVARASGDADVTVSAGSTLTFSATDWSTPKPVRIAAAMDADMNHDTAEVEVSSSGLTAQSVTVRVTDPYEGGGIGGSSGSGSGGTSGSASGGTNSGGTTSGGGTAGSSDPSGGTTGGVGEGGADMAGESGETGGRSGGAAGASAGRSAGGSAAQGGGPGPNAKESSDSGGCGCGMNSGGGSGATLGLLLLWLVRRTRKAARRPHAS